VIAGVDAAARKDAGKANVIINEKKDKKAAKYMLKDLPYPYTSAAQYEASFTTPVGADWNAIATHQRATMPRVTKKVGRRLVCGGMITDVVGCSLARLSIRCLECSKYMSYCIILYQMQALGVHV
jgi:hypothetical protein